MKFSARALKCFANKLPLTITGRDYELDSRELIVGSPYYTEEKTARPYDFHRWHDIQIDEYATKTMVEDAEKRKKMYAQFAAFAEKYPSLQHAKRSAFI